MAMDLLKAFLTGGTICALVQILLDRTRLMPGRVMVLLVVSGAVLGFLGLYQPFADWAGAGASVPLLGFGNTAGAAGICAALVFSYLLSLIFKPKMK